MTAQSPQSQGNPGVDRSELRWCVFLVSEGPRSFPWDKKGDAEALAAQWGVPLEIGVAHLRRFGDTDLLIRYTAHFDAQTGQHTE